MKRYIIKNADGSEQSEMQAIHKSRKEAGETLMDYIWREYPSWTVLHGSNKPFGMRQMKHLFMTRIS